MAKDLRTYVCWRECFHLNNHFKVGDKFPAEWQKNPTPEYCPNTNFCLQEDFDEKRNDAKANRQMFCAGDDPRSTNMLREALTKYMGNIPATWGRKEIWIKLREREMAEARTAPLPGQEDQNRKPGRPPAKV